MPITEHMHMGRLMIVCEDDNAQTMPQRAASEPIIIHTAKASEIDALANAMDHSRNYIVNQAIEQYLEANTWQMERIKSGISTSQIALLSWTTLEKFIEKRYM